MYTQKNKGFSIALAVITLTVLAGGLWYMKDIQYKNSSEALTLNTNISQDKESRTPLKDQYASSTCACPYKVVVVGGTGSTATHPIFSQIAKVAPNATNIALSTNGKKDDTASAEARMKAEVQKNTAANRKTLIIAHSLGSVLAINQFAGQECVEVFPIDPPVNMNGFICNEFNGLFSKTCKAILTAKKCLAGNPRNICPTYWCTNGTCKPMDEHDPYSAKNQTAIDAINKKIKEKLASCDATPAEVESEI